MATILTAYDRGTLYGRCDASCYDGHKTECTCICGGVNHGVGLNRAIENAATMADSWLKRQRESRNSRAVAFDVPCSAQKSLF